MIPRKRTILKAHGDYYTLTRAMSQDVCGEKNDRVHRKHLGQLGDEGFLNKTRMQVVSSLGATAPVYYLTRKGAEYLAAEFDERYLHCCTLCPNWQHLLHWIAVSQFHIVLDRAFAAQTHASIGGWIGEWQVANPEEKEPEKRYRLFTLWLEGTKRVVCNPDAAFLLCTGEFRIVHYLEYDRETSSLNQISASKSPGYVELLKRSGHDKHFDNNVDEFRVLSVSPTTRRRDLLRKAFVGKEGAKLWRFAAWSEFTPETGLCDAIWYPAEGEAVPLVKSAQRARERDLVGSAPGSEGGPP